MMNEAKLTVSEGKTLKQMALYWQEVEQRDNKIEVRSILDNELYRVINMLGSRRVLRMVEKFLLDTKIADLIYPEQEGENND